jgi:hypothetical protein
MKIRSHFPFIILKTRSHVDLAFPNTTSHLNLSFTKVKVKLRPTVSRPVYFDVGRPL